MIRRLTEVLPEVVGLKPTITEQVAFGATVTPVPTQVLPVGSTEKSPGASSVRIWFWAPFVLLVARPMLVMVIGASPVFLMVTALALSAAAVPAATLVKFCGAARTAGLT